MMRRPGVLAALACACAIATVALWFAVNDLAAGRELDAALRDGIDGLFPNVSPDLLRGARSLADALPFAIGATALVALAWLRAGRSFALGAAILLLVVNVVTQLSQPVLAGSRHVDLGAAQLHAAGSWPSGHAVAAMLLALGAIVVAGARLRPVTALVGLGYALGVGGALIALGGHLPSDILAGYLVAAAFTTAGAAVSSIQSYAAGPLPWRLARTAWEPPDRRSSRPRSACTPRPRSSRRGSARRSSRDVTRSHRRLTACRWRSGRQRRSRSS